MKRAALANTMWWRLVKRLDGVRVPTFAITRKVARVIGNGGQRIKESCCTTYSTGEEQPYIKSLKLWVIE